MKCSFFSNGSWVSKRTELENAAKKDTVHWTYVNHEATEITMSKWTEVYDIHYKDIPNQGEPKFRVAVTDPNGTYYSNTTVIQKMILLPTVYSSANGGHVMVYEDGKCINVNKADDPALAITNHESAANSSITMEAQPYRGYKFVAWEVDGKYVSYDQTLSGKPANFMKYGNLLRAVFVGENENSHNSDLYVYPISYTHDGITKDYPYSSGPRFLEYNYGEDKITLKIDAQSKIEQKQYVAYQIMNSDGSWGEFNKLGDKYVLRSQNNYVLETEFDFSKIIPDTLDRDRYHIRFGMSSFEGTFDTTCAETFTINVRYKVSIECNDPNNYIKQCPDVGLIKNSTHSHFSQTDDKKQMYQWISAGSEVQLHAHSDLEESVKQWKLLGFSDNMKLYQNIPSTISESVSYPPKTKINFAHSYQIYFDYRKLTTHIYSENNLKAGNAFSPIANGEQTLESYRLQKATSFDSQNNPTDFVDYNKDESTEEHILSPGHYKVTYELGFYSDLDKQLAASCDIVAGCYTTDDVSFLNDPSSTTDALHLVRAYDLPQYNGGETILYYHFFDIEGYTVKFILDEALTMNSYVSKEEAVKELTVDNENFLGWYEKGSSKKWDFSTPITADMELVAKFKEKEEDNSSSSEASSSSAKQDDKSSSSIASSSSAKQDDKSSSSVASSSSAKQDDKSSSSAASSSSAKQDDKSSSSAASSSSAKQDDKSSSSNTEIVLTNVRAPHFRLTVIGRNVLITGANVGSTYTILNMQGQITKSSQVSASNFIVILPQSGSYMFRIGEQIQHVNVR